MRQQVLGLPSSMFAGTYVVRLPNASTLGGADLGAVAVAWRATSTGSPTGALSVGAGPVGKVASVGLGLGVGLWLASIFELTVEGGAVSSAVSSPSPGESSSQTPPTATS